MVFTLFIPVRAAEKEYVNDRSTDTAQKIEFNGIACIFMIKFKKTNRRQDNMVTWQDVIENKEVEALIQGAQKQLDGLRLYRT